jgi:hypothetical protein
MFSRKFLHGIIVKFTYGERFEMVRDFFVIFLLSSAGGDKEGESREF